MLIFALMLDFAAGHELTSLQSFMSAALRAVENPSPAQALEVLGEGLWHAGLVVVVLGSVVMVVGVAASLAQGGFYIASKAVKPKLSKLNLLQGAKRLFGPHALWEGAKTLLKSVIVALL